MKLKGLKREQRLNCEQLTLVAVRGAEPMGFLKKKEKKSQATASQVKHFSENTCCCRLETAIQ